jgi:hypothetical protein
MANYEFYNREWSRSGFSVDKSVMDFYGDKLDRFE